MVGQRDSGVTVQCLPARLHIFSIALSHHADMSGARTPCHSGVCERIVDIVRHFPGMGLRPSQGQNCVEVT